MTSAPLPVRSPAHLSPLGREFEPAALWRLVCRLMRMALRDSGLSGSQVAAVAATSQREGIVLLDGDDVEIYAGPNTDFRAFFEGQTIDAERGEEVYRATGHLPSMLFAPAKLLWFRQHEPHAFERVRCVLSLDAWLAWRLSGDVHVTKAAAAESGLWDLTAGRLESGARYGLGLAGITPAIAQAGQMVGRVSVKAARQTGLAAGTIVAAGGPDTQCGLMGMGLVSPGEAGLVAGWSAPLQMVTAKPVLDGKRRTWTGLHLTEGACVLESNAGDAGGAYRWLLETFFPALPLAEAARLCSAEAATSPPGANGAMAFLGPRVANMGAVGGRAGGFVFPLLPTVHSASRADLFRAASENIAFAVAANLIQLRGISGLEVESIGFGGGMTRDRLFVRILADVLGRPVLVPPDSEVSARGAVMCAAVAAGAYLTLQAAAKRMAGRLRAVQPDPVRSLEYQEHFQRWQAAAHDLERLDQRL